MTNKEIGKYGENLAKDFLIKNGFKILETNFHYSKMAEIDLVALKDKKIHFVEVKTRTSNFFGSPLEAVDKRKIASIYQAGLFYIQKNKYSNFQIDVIGIVLDKNNKADITFLENVGAD